MINWTLDQLNDKLSLNYKDINGLIKMYIAYDKFLVPKLIEKGKRNNAIKQPVG